MIWRPFSGRITAFRFVMAIVLGTIVQFALAPRTFAFFRCTLDLNNTAGQVVQVAVLLGSGHGGDPGFGELPDSDNDPSTDAPAQATFTASGGEFSQVVNGPGWFTFSFKTVNAGETLFGGINKNTGDDFCTIVPGSADTAKVTYFDVDTAFSASRSGYGGPGSSGGAGDNTVRLVDPTAFNSCAMIYVFDDFEEMQTCCGCPITPDGMRTLSVINDLTFDFGVNKANLNAGVIDVVSSQPNFFQPSTPPPGPNPPGTNGNCSPTGQFSNDPFKRFFPVTPEMGGRAWITHAELQQPGNIAGGKSASSASVEEFQDLPLDVVHRDQLEQECAFLIQNGSGTGVCTCGVGDSFALGAHTKAR